MTGGSTQVARPAEAAFNLFHWNPIKELNLGGQPGFNQNLDRVDLINDIIVEEKDGTGLRKKGNFVDPAAPDPITAAKKRSEVQWSADQVFTNTKERVLFLKNTAIEQRHDHKDYVGSSSANLPDLAWVKRIHTVVIEVQANWAEFKQAVDADIVKLNKDPELKGYTFTVKYP